MDLTKLQEMEALMSKDNKKAGRSELGLRKKEQYLSPRATFLSKIKLVQGSSAMYVYPLELRLPFDPRDMGSEEFSLEDPFIMPWAVSQSIYLLKHWAATDAELHAKLAELARVDVAEYDLTEPEVVTDNDKKALWRFRNVIVYSTTIQQFNMSGFGKYGRRGLSTAQFDEFGKAVKKDLGFELYELEVAMANTQIAKLEAEYEPGGAKENLPKADLQKEKKEIWKGMKVKSPKPSGVMRVLTIPCTTNWNLKPEENQTTEDILDNLKDFEGYVGGSYDAVKEVESMIGTGYDKYVNHLEVGIMYPIGKGKTDNEKSLNSYNNREFSKNPLNPLGTMLAGFEAKYLEFRSDEEIFNEETILKSVFEFRPIDDDLLLEHYKADLGDKMHLINEGAAEKYMDLIQRIDSTLSEQLMMHVLTGETAKGQANLLAEDDGVKEYIIEQVDQEEESTSPVEDLLAGTTLN